VSEEGKPAGGRASRQLIVQPDKNGSSEAYSNLMMVNHRKGEFVLDWLFVQPQAGSEGQPVASLKSRVVTSPEHLKRVVRALTDNLSRYEAKFGVIEEGSDPQHSLH
jgi:hypothetical protein